MIRLLTGIFIKKDLINRILKYINKNEILNIYIFEDSAHSPLWEENDKMLSIMREKVKEESN